MTSSPQRRPKRIMIASPILHVPVTLGTAIFSLGELTLGLVFRQWKMPHYWLQINMVSEVVRFRYISIVSDWNLLIIFNTWQHMAFHERSAAAFHPRHLKTKCPCEYKCRWERWAGEEEGEKTLEKHFRFRSRNTPLSPEMSLSILHLIFQHI